MFYEPVVCYCGLLALCDQSNDSRTEVCISASCFQCHRAGARYACK